MNDEIQTKSRHAWCALGVHRIFRVLLVVLLFVFQHNFNLYYKAKVTFVLPTNTSHCYINMDLIMSTYYNDVTRRIKRYAQKLQPWRLCHQQQQWQQINVGVAKDPRYINYLEFDVDNDTHPWVYFEEQYRDPNLRFDKETEQWVPIHSHIIIIWICCYSFLTKKTDAYWSQLIVFIHALHSRYYSLYVFLYILYTLFHSFLLQRAGRML